MLSDGRLRRARFHPSHWVLRYGQHVCLFDILCIAAAPSGMYSTSTQYPHDLMLCQLAIERVMNAPMSFFETTVS